MNGLAPAWSDGFIPPQAARWPCMHSNADFAMPPPITVGPIHRDHHGLVAPAFANPHVGGYVGPSAPLTSGFPSQPYAPAGVQRTFRSGIPSTDVSLMDPARFSNIA